jgi:glycosyltransferase involved in cell wall biosynthesis
MAIRIGILGSSSQILINRWAKMLSENGYDVHLFSLPRPEKDFNWGNIKKHILKPSCGKSYLSYLIPTSEIKRIFQAYKLHILHAFELTNYGLFGARTGIKPYVVSATGSDILYHPYNSGIVKNILFRRIDDYTLRKSDIVTVETNIEKNFILDNYDVDEKKFRLLTYGVNTKNFKDLALRNHRKELLITIPRAVKERYNAEGILRAIQICVAKIPKTRFLFLAGMRDEAYYSKVTSLSRSLGIGKYVEFEERLLSVNEINRILSKTDIFISVPFTDCLPKTVFEGILCGAVPILSDIPANKNLVKMGISATIVNQSAPDDIAKGIIRTIKKLDDLRKNITTSQSIIEDNFSTAKTIETINTIYKELIKGE